eukprot:EC799674.1.p1 GENE.EC799674.1~~EC799674.1.p1  ORF type:complete len:199 (+),score=46.42 EC799674.1:137-733(+)
MALVAAGETLTDDPDMRIDHRQPSAAASVAAAAAAAASAAAVPPMMPAFGQTARSPMESSTRGSSSSRSAAYEHVVRPTPNCDFGEDSDELLTNAPAEMVCPLTHQLMRDPVVLVTGHVFERSAIEAWFNKCSRCRRPVTDPLTGQEVATTLIPVHSMRSLIQSFRNRSLDTMLLSSSAASTPRPSSSASTMTLEAVE